MHHSTVSTHTTTHTTTRHAQLYAKPYLPAPTWKSVLPTRGSTALRGSSRSCGMRIKQQARWHHHWTASCGLQGELCSNAGLWDAQPHPSRATPPTAHLDICLRVCCPCQRQPRLLAPCTTSGTVIVYVCLPPVEEGGRFASATQPHLQEGNPRMPPTGAAPLPPSPDRLMPRSPSSVSSPAGKAAMSSAAGSSGRGQRAGGREQSAHASRRRAAPTHLATPWLGRRARLREKQSEVTP